MIKYLKALSVILIAVCMTGCMKERTEIDFTTWDEAKVYAFLNEVLQYVREIPLETDSRERVVEKYEKYFAPGLSEKIFDSLYVKTDDKWKVPDGDAGYIFYVPTGEYEGSKVQFEFNRDYIIIQETYEVGMYSSIAYTIRDLGKPVITEWEQK